MKKSFENNSILDTDNLQQENLLFRNAIDQWSNRYEELRIKLEQTTKYLSLQFNSSNSKLLFLQIIK